MEVFVVKQRPKIITDDFCHQNETQCLGTGRKKKPQDGTLKCNKDINLTAHRQESRFRIFVRFRIHCPEIQYRYL